MERKLAKLAVTVAVATLMAGSTVMVASAEEAGCYYYDYETGTMIWCGDGYDGAYDYNGYYHDEYHEEYHDDYYGHDNGYHHDDSSHHDSGSGHHGGHHSGHH